MKLFICASLALLAFACLVQVQAGLTDLLGSLKGGDDKSSNNKGDESKKGQSHYQGGIGKQVAHTLVDGGVDRLVDVGETKFDNPVMHAALVGVGHKIKNMAHDKINVYGEQAKKEKERLEEEERRRRVEEAAHLVPRYNDLEYDSDDHKHKQKKHKKDKKEKKHKKHNIHDECSMNRLVLKF